MDYFVDFEFDTRYDVHGDSSAVADMGDRGHNRQGRRRHGGCSARLAQPGPMSTSVPSAVFIHPAVWPQQTWSHRVTQSHSVSLSL